MTTDRMHIQGFYDPATGTISYVLADPQARQAAVIDAVLDLDPKSGQLSTSSADRIAEYLRAQGWQLQWILETHAHADHLSAAQYLRHQLGGQVAMGERIRDVQRVFRSVFHFESGFVPDGRQFDRLFAAGEVFHVGQLPVTALWVPGHTPADMAYLVQGAAGEPSVVLVGDTLFMPDVGTARADFPGGDAGQLYRSIHQLLALPGDTRLFMCHDYPPAGRAPAWECTVADQRRSNIHVRDGISEADFVQMRQARDATLAMPTLILPSVQVNVRAGKLPPAQGDGRTYIQLPVNALGAGAGQPLPPGVGQGPGADG
ncbi:MAG: MBL fold metallo-hydrolase [Comamonas sp.]